MNSDLQAKLNATPVQAERLRRLQAEFAEVCNAIAPLAQQTHCWNRVALHHMVYRTMRERFPTLGSQMVCNAIYSVSRCCRLVYQHPKSPFNLQRLNGRPLPRVHFLPQSPVYFDRHTLSLKNGQVSMFTLDGRMRFELPLAPHDEARFRHDKLREIVLTSRGDQFSLRFRFTDPDDDGDRLAEDVELPEYMLVTGDAAPPPADRPAPPRPAPQQP